MLRYISAYTNESHSLTRACLAGIEQRLDASSLPNDILSHQAAPEFRISWDLRGSLSTECCRLLIWFDRMASQCVGENNSTDCLLRALILATEQQQDPWSSKNFAVTLVIGVAAAIISVVAVFQGLLAAGPGRIKAGPSAIGNFARLTRGHVSFTEFAYKSIARVPVITHYSLRDGLMRQSWFVEHGKDYPFDAGGMSTGATWLHLLKCTGLDQEVGEVFRESLQECATDHLPSDIQAPTAFIQLSCLAILAAIADPTIQFEKADRFVSIRGRVSQISFRENPVLGTVAAYERTQTQYKPEHDAFFAASTDTKPSMTLGRCTVFALDLAMGELTLAWSMGAVRSQDSRIFRLMNFSGSDTSFIILKWDRAHFEKVPHSCGYLDHSFAGPLTLMYARTDYELRPFPWKKSKLSVEWFLDATEKYRKDLPTLESYLHPSGCQNDSGWAYNTRAAPADSIFDLFGTWTVPHKERLIDGNFGNTFCKEFLQAVEYIISQRQISIKAGNVVDATNLNLNYSERRVLEACWFLKHIDILLRKWQIRAMDALDVLTRRLVDEAGTQETLTRQTIITPPLSPVSSSSSCVSPTYIGPASPKLGQTAPLPVQTTSTPRSSTSIAPSVGVRASLQLSGSLSNPSSRRTSCVSTKESVPKEITLEQSLECLLIFRGFFLATLLESGPDTSMLLDPTFRNEIMKVM